MQIALLLGRKGGQCAGRGAAPLPLRRERARAGSSHRVAAMISPPDNRLTPDAVQAVSFPPARIGRRGLDEDHVQAFCGLVQRELLRLLSERASLAAEVQRLRVRALGPGGRAPGHPSQPDHEHVQAVRILSGAQQTAQRYVADAQEYSKRLTAEAQRRREEMLEEAYSRATVIIEKAYGHITNSVDALAVLNEVVVTLEAAYQASRAAQGARAGLPERTHGYPPPDAQAH
jgi:cell division septum initiation protein DivIVA